MEVKKHHLIRDLSIIALSIILAIALVKSGTLGVLLSAAQEIKILGAFLAGMFFVSVFTVSPASVVIGELMKSESLFFVAAVAGLGGLCGDLLIFRFIKDSLVGDLAYLLRGRGLERLAVIFSSKSFKWLIVFLGAVIVASPFPDELGIALLGLTKLKTSLFIPVSFTLNFMGILIVGSVVKSFI